jgi:hypothetical protein
MRLFKRKVNKSIMDMPAAYRGVLSLLLDDSVKWKLGLYIIKSGKLEIWTANRPYADMGIYTPIMDKPERWVADILRPLVDMRVQEITNTTKKDCGERFAMAVESIERKSK